MGHERFKNLEISLEIVYQSLLELDQVTDMSFSYSKFRAYILVRQTISKEKTFQITALLIYKKW